MAWTSTFSEPISLPSGKKLVTLRDAGKLIERLPESEVSKSAWQVALDTILQAADHHGPVEFARIAMMQALFPKGEPTYHSASKDPVWRNNRKLARDK